MTTDDIISAIKKIKSVKSKTQLLSLIADGTKYDDALREVRL